MRNISSSFFSAVFFLTMSNPVTAQVTPPPAAPLQRTVPPVTTYDATCRSENDDATLASCIWAIIRAYPDVKQSTNTGNAATALVSRMLEDVTGQEPLRCYAFAEQMTQTLSVIKQDLRTTILQYEPKSCAELAKFVRALTIVDPSWAGCPSGEYSAKHIEACLRSILNREGDERAIRYLLTGGTANSGSIPPRIQLMFKSINSQINLLKATRTYRHATLQADAVRCSTPGVKGSDTRTAEYYAGLATSRTLDVAAGNSASLARRSQVTCDDIIAVAQAFKADVLQVPLAGAAETRCRAEAGTIYEAGRHGVGVPWDKIDGPHAVAACREALELSPENDTVKLMLSRALIVNNQDKAGLDILATVGYTNDGPVGMLLLRDILYYGINTPADKKTAAGTVMLAAQTSNAAAQSMMGYHYFFGDGVERNLATAAEWLNKAGENRLPFTTTLLGLMYFNGEGVPRNDVRAVQLFQSVEQYDCSARFYLAVAKDTARGGLKPVDPNNLVDYPNLEAQYRRVARDATCPADIRKIAQTRENEIFQRPSRNSAATSSPGFMNSLSQALELGAKMMILEEAAKRAGLISPETEKKFGKAVEEFQKNSIRRQEEGRQYCLSQGYSRYQDGYCYN